VYLILYDEAAEEDLRVFYDLDENRGEVVVRAVRRKGSKTTKEIL